MRIARATDLAHISDDATATTIRAQSVGDVLRLQSFHLRNELVVSHPDPRDPSADATHGDATHGHCACKGCPKFICRRQSRPDQHTATRSRHVSRQQLIVSRSLT
jgi:hypothetical protein